jgi:hypothetical protein
MDRKWRKAAWQCSAVVIAVAVALPVASVLAAPTTRTSVPARLVGTWGKTLSAATWQKNLVFTESGGHWAIVISRAGVLSIFLPPGRPNAATPASTMRVAGSGASLLFRPTPGGDCPNKASYTWKVSGRTLVLKVVKDSCNLRRILFTAGAWQRM